MKIKDYLIIFVVALICVPTALILKMFVYVKKVYISFKTMFLVSKKLVLTTRGIEEPDAYQSASPELRRKANIAVLGFEQTKDCHYSYISTEDYDKLVEFCKEHQE